jgi:DNA-binding IclR family transcriptional regulator
LTPRRDTKEEILKILRNHPEGLMLTEIAGIIGMNRFTVTKYIHELIGNGSVFQKEAAAARICYIREQLANRNREIIEVLRKKVKTSA